MDVDFLSDISIVLLTLILDSWNLLNENKKKPIKYVQIMLIRTTIELAINVVEMFLGFLKIDSISTLKELLNSDEMKPIFANYEDYKNENKLVENKVFNHLLNLTKIFSDPKNFSIRYYNNFISNKHFFVGIFDLFEKKNLDKFNYYVFKRFFAVFKIFSFFFRFTRYFFVGFR